jgi:signal transduction histidine kinase
MLKARIKKLLAASSTDEDAARREFILNILLMSGFCLVLVSFVVSLLSSFLFSKEALQNSHVWAGYIFLILVFLRALLYISHKGHSKVSSILLLAVFFLLAAYLNFTWGVDLPIVVLTYAVTIIMSGILISTRFAFFTTLVICPTIVVICYLHDSGLIEINRYWRTQQWTQADNVAILVLFFIVATVSWLSNREIEKSLKRARKSEADLKLERDSLEIKVEERTKELKETQMEQMAQMYRFAEFGRLSSGLFHDLINPLNAVSLNMGKVKSEDSKPYLDKAITAAKKMEDFIVAIRKQINHQENETSICLSDEVEQVIEILNYRARKANVKIKFLTAGEIKIVGDVIKFNQVALNLITNAIDSYDGFVPIPHINGEHDKNHERKVIVNLHEDNGMIEFIVTDHGKGISPENLNKIFEPFFTTKSTAVGIGLGLSLVKRIVEKDFLGSINVTSAPNEGSVFSVRFPHKQI